MASILPPTEGVITPARLAIADPPYPPQFTERADGRVTSRSRARRYYGNGTRPQGETPADFHPDAGEWDDPARHHVLLEELMEKYDGWAIATTPDGIECYRPFPIACRIMAWVKPTAPAGSHRLRSTWEAVIVYTPTGRRAGRGQLSDVLIENAPRIGFPGAKPERWTRWVLDAMGHEVGDEVIDLFPGSGSVTRALAQDPLFGGVA